MSIKKVLIISGIAVFAGVILCGLYLGSKDPHTISRARERGFTEGKGNTNTYGDKSIGEMYKDDLLATINLNNWIWSDKQDKFFGLFNEIGDGSKAQTKSLLGFKELYDARDEGFNKSSIDTLSKACKSVYEKELSEEKEILEIQLKEISWFCTDRKELQKVNN